MQPLDPTITTNELKKLSPLKFKNIQIRVGKFYKFLNDNQKDRFNRIVNQLAKRLGFALNQNPMEMLLIRQIALDTVKIEEDECLVLETLNMEIEKLLLLLKKERREAIQTLFILTKSTDKKESVSKFDILRDDLREDAGLKKGKKGLLPDGHDRRHYDDITRTV